MRTRVETNVGILTTAVAICVLVSSGTVAAQDSGRIQGTVVSAETREGISQGLVSIEELGARVLTDGSGRFALAGIPAGRHTLTVRALGYATVAVDVQVPAGGTATATVELRISAIQLSELVVQGVSLGPELAIEAPAAVSRVSESIRVDYGPTGQVAQALVRIPGVDAVQSGVNDWSVNSRGFNTTNTRRTVVLMDGRDLSLAFLGSQEWPALSVPLSDFENIEMIRGPGSALYGPNAFSGVLNLTTPSARAVQGTKIELAGGQLETLQGDIRHAMVINDRFGIRVHGGYVQSDTWARSRTNLGDLDAEYDGIVDRPITPPAPGYEVVPLAGQSTGAAFGVPAAATGDRDPVTRTYGGLRLDYYAESGGTFTTEAGWSRNRNESSVTGAGRFQIGEARRPWARMSWTGSSFNAQAYYSGRSSDDQVLLGSGAVSKETSSIFHGEAQYHRRVLAGRGRVVMGGSARTLQVDSRGTLLAAASDDRSDATYSGYGQFELDLTSSVKVVAATRVDKGDLFDTQFSPKAGLVWTPHPDHALRLTVNRAFKTPVLLEQFLEVPAGAPLDFSLLEAGLRASDLGPLLAGVPDGELFTVSGAVPVLALGNQDLDVETVLSWELGYKAQLSEHVFFTVDGYYANLDNFITELLPGVNPTYGLWTAPAGVPAGYEDVVADAVISTLASVDPALGATLTRLQDGTTAIVVSVGNSGAAKGYGVDLGMGARLPEALEIDANYSYFGFDVDPGGLAVGQLVVPNTPKHKFGVTVGYGGIERVQLRASARLTSSFDWAGGVWMGRVPALQVVDVMGGYGLREGLRLSMTVTNLFDQNRYQVFGGPLIGRRILGGLTLTF